MSILDKTKMKLSDIFYPDDLWICDPKKCPNCSKTCCHDGFCYHTSDKNQRARGIRRFIFFLEFLIFGVLSWKLRYKWHSSSNRRLYNFISSIWEKSIPVSCFSTLVFAGVMIVFIFSRIGIDCMVYNVKVKHDTLIYEYEMLNSDCEDISKIEVIDKIKDWNKSVYWERYWADNIWTNWFHPKKITEAYEYIELD